jgi:hypothetical protein
MSLPIDKPCISCAGKYEVVIIDEKYGDFRISSVILNEVGSTIMQMVKCVLYRCDTCGNVQSFLEEQPKV